MTLPVFKYHPDPIATGSIEEEEITCAACGLVKPFVYVGPVYSEADLERSICPWCISSGLAHDKFDAEFTDSSGIGDGDSEDTPVEVVEEVAYRTPGFSGWQQERWLVHCEDACAFLGPAGKKELAAYNNRDLLESLRADLDMTYAEFQDYFEGMNREGGPTAYVFRCLHCGKLQGYSDMG